MDVFRYSLRKISEASGEIVTLAQARHNCSIDGTDHDSVLADLILQAREYVQERTDASLLTTVWEMTADAFPTERHLYLPRWPVQSIGGVEYSDGALELAEIDSDDLVLRLDDHGRGRLALVGWSDWPTTGATPDAMKITFTAGWASAGAVPPMWARAMLMLVAWWFEQREAAVIGAANSVPMGVEDLLASVSTADDFGEYEFG